MLSDFCHFNTRCLTFWDPKHMIYVTMIFFMLSMLFRFAGLAYTMYLFSMIADALCLF